MKVEGFAKTRYDPNSLIQILPVVKFLSYFIKFNKSKGSNLTSLYNVEIAKQRIISTWLTVQWDKFYAFHEILASYMMPQQNMARVVFGKSECTLPNPIS